jgi:LysM repeat protein
VGRARRIGLATTLSVAAMVAAGCGDDGSATQGTLPPIATTTTSTTIPETTTTVPEFYEVQPGDTLFAIAERFGVDTNALMMLNGITNPDHIEAGQQLKLPAPSTAAATTTSAATTTT